jgi:uncharacterized protein (UPF0333 family)
MKKRKARNYGIFTVFLIAFLLITSIALAGPGSKNTTEKKIAENVTDKKEKVETKSTTEKTTSNNTTVKEVGVKKTITTDDKEKSAVKKKVEVINLPNKKKSEDKTPNVQFEKTKIEPSNEKKNTTSPDKIYDNQLYKRDADKNISSKNELMIHSKSIIDKNSASDNEIIENYLKVKPHGTPSNYISPRPILEPEEIEHNTEVKIIIYNNIEYRWYYGYYYEPWNGCYRRIWPSFGWRISWLPPYYYDFWWHDIEYYYCCNVYYVYYEDEDEYVVVRPPVGALVETIPDYSEKLIVEGETYFIADGIQYKAVLVNDEIWFKVLKFVEKNEYAVIELPVGSLVEIMPDERELLFIDGETYYIADDVQYKAVLVNDEIWFKVLKIG